MNKILFPAILIGCLLFSAGCGATHYTIYMKSGEEIVATGQPKYNEKSNTVTYENVEGQKVAIQKDDIDRVIKNLK